MSRHTQNVDVCELWLWPTELSQDSSGPWQALEVLVEIAFLKNADLFSGSPIFSDLESVELYLRLRCFEKKFVLSL